MRGLKPLAFGAAFIALGTFAWWSTSNDRASTALSPRSEVPAGTAGPIDWVVAGGGPTPDSNEVSIEDDLALATEVLRGEGVLLYAGGPDTRAVRVESEKEPDDPLVAELGRIFDPRPARASTYRPTRLKPAAAANAHNFLDAVHQGSQQSAGPLTVWVSGHGDQGATPADNGMLLWGNDLVTPTDLATAFEEAPPRRVVRFIATTCFSGGFAEIAFAGADPTRGAIDGDVCGLFASTAYREAGGCDPNPERGAHDGYAVHFLSALAGKTRGGETIAVGSRDFDGDGTTSYLDAHTWARLKSGSVDVPTTTSERWLRSLSLEQAAPDATMPHEDAVIAALGAQLGLETEGQVQQRLAELDEELVLLRETETKTAEAETMPYRTLAADLLSRWPVLSDPWHPAWRTTLDAERGNIERFLAEHPAHAALQEAMRQTDAASHRRSEKEIEQTPLLRLARAFETRRLAAALQAQGGSNWERFQKFRACENSGP